MEFLKKIKAIQDSINERITQMNAEQQKAQAELAKQNEELRKSMEEKINQLSQEEEKARGEIWKESRGFGKSMREELLLQTKTFQEQMNQRMKQINHMQDKNRQQLGQMAESVSKIEADVSEAGIRAVNPASGRVVGYAVIVLGIIFGAGTLYVFYTSLGEPFTAYTLVVMTVMAIITVTLLVIGTLI